jgi:hypothetical protein
VRWLAILACGCGFRHGTISADASPDAPPDVSPDATLRSSFVIEAESYTSTASPQPAYVWTAVTDVPGYSGSAFMQVIPADGTYCDVPAMLATCAASLVYDLPGVAAGTYYFHTRLYSMTMGDDSLWFGLDGAAIGPALIPPVYNAWTWKTSASFPVAEGNHTLVVWQREAGERVDIVALTQSATPPPP